MFIISGFYPPLLKGVKYSLGLGLFITRTSLASVMGTEASTEVTVSRGLVLDTHFPGVRERGDRELLVKATDPVKSTLPHNPLLMELLARDANTAISAGGWGGRFHT